MSGISPADDRLHPPAEAHPHWTETSWFGFHVAERSLGGVVYPVFRPNLGVCSLAVHVWDAQAHEPWRVPYSRSLWHLPAPQGELTDLQLAGLRLLCLEALSRYRVEFEDANREGDELRLSLTYEGLMPPHGVGIAAGRGHLDQPCRVHGSLVLRGQEIAVDCLDLRDRSWGVRDDLRSVRASYSYAFASADEGFLAAGFHDGERERLLAGFLLREGRSANLVSGERRVLERRDGYPARVSLSAEDELGRRLEAEGRPLSRLAFQATPGMFAWMSLVAWQLGPAVVSGADQEVWSPDALRSSGR